MTGARIAARTMMTSTAMPMADVGLPISRHRMLGSECSGTEIAAISSDPRIDGEIEHVDGEIDQHVEPAITSSAPG